MAIPLDSPASMYTKWYDEYKTLQEQKMMKSIVIVHQNKCVAYGSLRFLQQTDRLQAIVCDICLDETYASVSQLLHKVCFTLEVIAESMDCNIITV